MSVPSIEAIAAKVFQAYGYEIHEIHGSLILCMRNSKSLAVLLDPEVSQDHVSHFLDDVKADDYLVVSLSDRPIEENAYLNVPVWSKERLEKEIGKATLATLLGNLPLQGPDGIGRSVPLILEMADVGEAVITPKIDKNKATIISRSIEGYKFELTMVPHFLFYYKCVVEDSEKQTGDIQTGIAAVNGTSGDVELWTHTFETVENVEIPHIKMEPTMNADDAQQQATKGVFQLFTREVDVVREDSNVTVFEKIKTQPREDSIEVLPKGLVYNPYWRIEGTDGKMTIDAVTGKIITHEKY